MQVVQRSSSRSSENENLTDVSLNLEDSKNGEGISGSADGASDNIDQSTIAGSENSFEISGNSGVNSQNDNNNSNDGDNSQNLSGEALQSLEEKVVQLTEEKRVLLLSMQTLTSQWASRENCSESDSSFVTALETNLREVEQENACLSETLQRIRNVLEEEREHENNNEQEDKILKLKDELQRLDEKFEASRSRSFTFGDDNVKTDAGCERHEERISELEMEIYRLHEEKKSLLSSIVRLKTDPNFTLSDEINESDIINISDVMVDAVTNGGDANNTDVIDSVQQPSTKDTAVSERDSGVRRIHNPLVKTASRDEEVQVNMSREDVYGLLGFLQRDLDKLRTALDQEGIARSKAEKDDDNVRGEYL